MPSNVPLAREMIEEAIELTSNKKVRKLLRNSLSLLHRDPYARRAAPVKSKEVNAAMAKRLRRYAFKNPRLSEQEIAVRYDINAGRVSEALHHLR